MFRKNTGIFITFILLIIITIEIIFNFKSNTDDYEYHDSIGDSQDYEDIIFPTTVIDNYSLELIDDKYYITGITTPVDNIKFPTELNGIEVGGISKLALSELDVDTVELGYGYYVGEYSFYKSTIKKLIIPDYCIIDNGAFSDCTQLTEVVWTGISTDLNIDSFRGCTSLTKIDISEGLREINKNCFKDCNSLESLVIPSSVMSIDDAFTGSSLSEIKGYPNSYAESLAKELGITFTCIGPSLL